MSQPRCFPMSASEKARGFTFPDHGRAGGPPNGIDVRRKPVFIHYLMQPAKLRLFLILVLALIAVVPAEAATPNIISYQGRVRSGSGDFSGPGQFKFAILRSGTVWWRNAPDGNGDGEPDTAVAQMVTNGLFSVALGDTSIPNMAAMTFFDPADPSNASASTAPIVLRIWFGDGLSGFQQLAPDQPLSSAPFALWAANVGAGAITSAQLANGAVTSGKLAANSINSSHIAPGTISASDLATGVRAALDAPDGSPANVVTVNNAGLVNIGVPSSGTNIIRPPDGTITAWAAPSTIGLIVPQDSFGASHIVSGDSSGGFVAAFDGASGLAVSGTTAFVVARDQDTFTVVNNTDPTAPVIIGMLRDGVGGVTSLDAPEAVAVVGNFAYVVSRGTDQAFTVINITSPGAPTVSAVRTDGVGGFNDLRDPSAVAVSLNGNTAFVAAESDDSVSIINVTTKTSPTLTAVIKDEVGGVTTLNAPRQFIVSGSRLYVRSSEAITIFNISTLASPTVISTVSGLKQAMALNGNTLFVTTSTELETLDVSGATPVSLKKSTLRDFASGSSNVPLFNTTSLSIDGTDLWAVANGGSVRNRLLIFDVTNPAAPVLTHMAAAGASPGPFIREEFITSPEMVIGTGSGNAVAINSTPGAFVSLRKAGASIRQSLLAEGPVGIGVAQPMAYLHVAGSVIFEGGTLSVGNSGQSAFAQNSLAVGQNNIMRSDNSAAVGEGLVVGASETSSNPEFTVGRFNVPSTSGNSIRFSVGNGAAGARTNALTITTSGNIGLNGVSAPTSPIQHASGAVLTAGGSWVNASDRDLKENIRATPNTEVLAKVAALPIYTWNLSNFSG